jgi:hypothetical protein
MSESTVRRWAPAMLGAVAFLVACCTVEWGARLLFGLLTGAAVGEGSVTLGWLAVNLAALIVGLLAGGAVVYALRRRVDAAAVPLRPGRAPVLLAGALVFGLSFCAITQIPAAILGARAAELGLWSTAGLIAGAVLAWFAGRLVALLQRPAPIEQAPPGTWP